jgi:hypothetical protein
MPIPEAIVILEGYVPFSSKFNDEDFTLNLSDELFQKIQKIQLKYADYQISLKTTENPVSGDVYHSLKIKSETPLEVKKYYKLKCYIYKYEYAMKKGISFRVFESEVAEPPKIEINNDELVTF